MGKLFKNLIPYWKSVIIIFCLLIVQAYCDLALPQYTSDIIDVGIINSGTEYILPEAVTAQTYEGIQMIMTEDEREAWIDSFEKQGEYYVAKPLSDEELEEEKARLLALLQSEEKAKARGQVCVEKGKDTEVPKKKTRAKPRKRVVRKTKTEV